MTDHSDPGGVGHPDEARLRAEALWEELGGDLCVCQRAEVLHWCETCQRRIQTIEEAFARLPVPPPGAVPAAPQDGIWFCLTCNRRVPDMHAFGTHQKQEHEVYFFPKPAAVPAAQDARHAYLSTACWHGLHDRCRLECKFCDVACACTCHVSHPSRQEPPHEQ